jgi:pimeloyl-ACP methyl ester carboxylesterase
MILRQSATSYDVAGPAGARPILFVHGTQADMRFGTDAAIQQVAAVLNAEGSERALLVGSSLGGYLCLEFACRYPERVVGLVLSGCTLNLRGPIALPFRAGGWFLGRISERHLVAIQAALCRRVFPAAIAEPLIEAGFYFAAVPDALQALVGRDFRPLLRECASPVLFLNGQRDRVFRWHERAFVAAARNARLQLIPRGSHRCNLEYPGAFSAAVRSFAREIGW